MEFAEVRIYQPGDDVRSIDWRVTARRQSPHTKLFDEERERPLLIICDQSKSQFFGSRYTFKSVRAAQAAALFAWTALNKNDRVGGIVFSESGHHEVKPARNRKSTMQLLSLISQFNRALNIDNSVSPASFSLDQALIEATRLAKPGTMIVIISDFAHVSPRTEKTLAGLTQHNELIFVRTFDPLEEQLPPPGNYPVSDGKETLVLSTSSKHSRQEYENWAIDRNEHLRSLALRFKAAYIELSTHEEASARLQRVLQNLRK